MSIFTKFKKQKTASKAELIKVARPKEVLSDTDAFGYDFLAYGLMLSNSFQCKEQAYRRLDLCASSTATSPNINDLKQAMVTVANSSNSLGDLSIIKAYFYALESIAYLRIFNCNHGTSYMPNELLSQFLPKADLPVMYKKVNYSEYNEEEKLYTEKFLTDDVWTLYDKLEELIRKMDEKYDPEVCISTVEKILQDLYQKYQFPENEQLSFLRENEDAILFSFKPIEIDGK